MGFGEKLDPFTSRTLNLDKTYAVIKRGVEDAGVECIRADEIMHSGVIDKPMYELLLDADVVVADLSTSNANAIYELGVRHALRPRTTIVIAEQGFKFPFDVGHLVIRTYEHLGKGLEYDEAERLRKVIGDAVRALVEKNEVDSPVFTFLPKLLQDKTATLTEPDIPPAADESIGEMMELFKEARADENWKGAARILVKLHEKLPNDVYITQQLALATYKIKQKTPEEKEAALLEAKKILQTLNPEQTADSETLGLWGAVHKRLWECKNDITALEQSIWAYEKGFFLKNDHYNGINFAFLLDARATTLPPREALADVVTAERVRRRVITICEGTLAKGITDDKGNTDAHETFWVRASRVEAHFGLGKKEKSEELKKEAVAEAPESWMPATLEEQLGKLQGFFDRRPPLPA